MYNYHNKKEFVVGEEYRNDNTIVEFFDNTLYITDRSPHHSSNKIHQKREFHWEMLIDGTIIIYDNFPHRLAYGLINNEGKLLFNTGHIMFYGMRGIDFWTEEILIKH